MIATSYEDYKDARNAVWQLLAKYQVAELPVRLSEICKGEGIELYSYKRAAELIDSLRLWGMLKNNDGLAFCIADHRIILFDDTCSPGRQRFTVAHEMGHLLMGHVDDIRRSGGLQRHMRGEKETQANVFASRLLAPLCVLWGMDISSADELQRVCSISAEAAQYRYERLCEIRQRNENGGMGGGNGVLLASGYERAVYRNFHNYIKNYRLSSASSPAPSSASTAASSAASTAASTSASTSAGLSNTPSPLVSSAGDKSPADG